MSFWDFITGGNHGGNRKAIAQIHGSTNAVTNTGAGTPTPGSVTWTPGAWVTHTGISSQHATQRALANQLALNQAAQNRLMQRMAPEVETQTKPAEYTGVELGEVEAWRVWKVKQGHLVSMTNDTVWMPGEPVYGEPSQIYHSGIHAFKSAQEARSQYEVVGVGPMAFFDNHCAAAVVGKILLWGEIIEFEKGYRAEYGMVAEVAEIWPASETDMLAELKAKYDNATT